MEVVGVNGAGHVVGLDPYALPVVQYRIAVGLLALLAAFGVIIAAFAFLNPANKDAVSGLVTGLFSPLVALAGGATGFYFGASPEEESA
jgi:hypothetical protein